MKKIILMCIVAFGVVVSGLKYEPAKYKPYNKSGYYVTQGSVNYAALNEEISVSNTALTVGDMCDISLSKKFKGAKAVGMYMFSSDTVNITDDLLDWNKKIEDTTDYSKIGVYTYTDSNTPSSNRSVTEKSEMKIIAPFKGKYHLSLGTHGKFSPVIEFTLRDNSVVMYFLDVDHIAAAHERINTYNPLNGTYPKMGSEVDYGDVIAYMSDVTRLYAHGVKIPDNIKIFEYEGSGEKVKIDLSDKYLNLEDELSKSSNPDKFLAEYKKSVMLYNNTVLSEFHKTMLNYVSD